MELILLGLGALFFASTKAKGGAPRPAAINQSAVTAALNRRRQTDVQHGRDIYGAASGAAEDIGSCISSGTNCGEAWQGIKDTAGEIAELYEDQCRGGVVLPAKPDGVSFATICAKCPPGTTPKRLTIQEAISNHRNVNKDYWCVSPGGSRALGPSDD